MRKSLSRASSDIGKLTPYISSFSNTTTVMQRNASHNILLLFKYQVIGEKNDCQSASKLYYNRIFFRLHLLKKKLLPQIFCESKKLLHQTSNPHCINPIKKLRFMIIWIKINLANQDHHLLWQTWAILWHPQNCTVTQPWVQGMSHTKQQSTGNAELLLLQLHHWGHGKQSEPWPLINNV
jgi:hypothetical protein